MAIAFDAVGGDVNVSATTTASWSHTVAGGPLFVDVIGDIASDLLSSVTFNSVGADGIIKIQGNRWTYKAYWMNPATGTQTVLVTMGSTADAIAGLSTSYTATSPTVDQTVTSVTGGAASTKTTAIVTGVGNCWAHLTESGYSATSSDPFDDGNTTTHRRIQISSNGVGGSFDSFGLLVSAGSHNMTTNRSISLNAIAHLIVSFYENTGGGGIISPPALTLMGVGQ